MRSLTSALACALLFLALPGSAAAQQTNAPPGNAGIDEYLETVPAGDGNRGVTPDRGGSSAIGAETRGDLEAMGPEGKLAADLAEGGATAAGSPRPGRGGSDPDSAGGVSALPDEGAGSPVQAVVEAVTGGAASDAGMGPLLPILLLLTLAAMVAAAIMRRRASE